MLIYCLVPTEDDSSMMAVGWHFFIPSFYKRAYKKENLSVKEVERTASLCAPFNLKHPYEDALEMLECKWSGLRNRDHL